MNVLSHGSNWRGALPRAAWVRGALRVAAVFGAAACSIDTRGVGGGDGDPPAVGGAGGSGGVTGSAGTSGGASGGGTAGLSTAGGAGQSSGAGGTLSVGGAPPSIVPTDLPGADAGSLVPEPEPEQVPGNYLQTGDWQGFVTVRVDTLGSTVSPTSFEGHAAGEPYCISGTVAPDESYGGFVLLTFNLQQPLSGGPDGPAAAVVPAGQAVSFELTSQGSSVLRTQLIVDDVTWWCRDVAELSGTVTIPYSDFREQCWFPVGETAEYPRAPVQALRFVVAGLSVDPVPFNFCVGAIAELP